jgi:hypothetical protein
MSDLVLIHAYTNRFEAEQAQQYLAGYDIDAMVQADDAGGMYAGLSLSRRGVRLWTRAADAELARELLMPGVPIDPPVVEAAPDHVPDDDAED